MSFPLYDSLNKNIPKKDLTAKQKQELLEKIKNMDKNGVELIYALIQFHYIKCDCQTSDKEDTIPYKGSSLKNEEKSTENITWNLNELPVSLRHILHKFTLIHYKKMQEDANRKV
jgi:hypothetical protein